MNSNKIRIFGYSLLIIGILFLASSVAGFVMMAINLFNVVTSTDGNFDYLFLFFLGLFWCGTHFLIGRYLAQTGKRIVSGAEELSKNLWLQPKYHLSTLKNVSVRRFLGYVMCAIGIFLLSLFGINCLKTIFNIANLFILKISAPEYPEIIGIFFGFIILSIYFFLGRFLMRKGKRLALVVQHGNRRSALFYLRYWWTISPKKVVGYILCTVGFIFILLSSISMIAGFLSFMGGSGGRKLLDLVFEQLGTIGYFVGGWLWGAIYIFLGRYTMKKGKEFAALSGEELLSIDERPPVLYLRSFWNDEEMAAIPKQTAKKFSWYHWVFMPVRNQEELLAKQLKRIGPPLAVGQPNEKLPRLGMARMYFSDDEWQEKVTGLINRSALVIMLAGFTDNFWWELETAVKNIDPKKLLILFPFETQPHAIIGIADKVDAYLLFQNKAETILPKKLPNFTGTIVPGSNLSGLMWFDSDWNPKVYELSQTGKSLKKSLIHVFSYY
jgi:hypothetical protein